MHLKAELFKFVHQAGCIIGWLLAIVLPIMVNIITFLGKKSVGDAHVFLLSLNLFSIGVIMMAACYWGGEYDSGMLRNTLLYHGNRVKAYLAKLIVIIAAIICAFVALLGITYLLEKNQLASFDEIDPQRLLLILLSGILMTFISLGLSMIFKSSLIAIAILFSLQVGGSQVLLSLVEMAKFLPDLAAFNLYQAIPAGNLLSIQQGVILQLVWGILAIAASVALLMKRDVK